MPKVDILKLGIQLLKSIEIFHQYGTVHLNISPQTVLFGLGTKVSQVNLQTSYEKMRKKEALDEIARENLSDFRYHDLKESPVYLINYQKNRRYLLWDGKHLPNAPDNSEKTKNIIFASKNYFSNDNLSRRDDIISIVYLLIYLMSGPNECEMINIFNDSEPSEEYEMMKKYKLKATPE